MSKTEASGARRPIPFVEQKARQRRLLALARLTVVRVWCSAQHVIASSDMFFVQGHGARSGSRAHEIRTACRSTREVLHAASINLILSMTGTTHHFKKLQYSTVEGHRQNATAKPSISRTRSLLAHCSQRHPAGGAAPAPKPRSRRTLPVPLGGSEGPAADRGAARPEWRKHTVRQRTRGSDFV